MDKTINKRYLTKSLFTLAVECPAKLNYTGRPEYANRKVNDAFLQALADGGFQIGELAKLMFPGGVAIAGNRHEEQLEKSQRLMEHEEIILYEGAIAFDGLFARVDVLRKVGQAVELIEVKAKSFDSSDQHPFRTATGRISAEFLPYLQDICFQQLIFSKAYPDLTVSSHLMLVDKCYPCSVDGLNQRFKISRDATGAPRVAVLPGTNEHSIGKPILRKVNVDEYINELLSTPLMSQGLSGHFEEVILEWAEHYQKNQRIPSRIGAQCAKCEFHNEGDLKKRSGRHECWSEALGWSDEQLVRPTVLDLWNFRRKQELMDRKIFFLSSINKSDINPSKGPTGLSASLRQWMQVSGEWPGGGAFYLDRDLIRSEMEAWEYPLHMVDFETARVAIPFFKGQRPYANIAFQFSIHTIERDRSVQHRAEFLNAKPGENPNYEFARKLKSALKEQGSVFMWTPHENTTLNAILEELQNNTNKPDDAEDLILFLRSLTKGKEIDGTPRQGRRMMIDLCDIASRAYFNPGTQGSSSIKKVLPATMQQSEYIRDKYSKPIYGASNGIKSHNFKDFVWWRIDRGNIIDPYKLLHPIFDDHETDSLLESQSDYSLTIAHGGAATMAYASLQFEDMPKEKRAAIEFGLKRYCELDTLAMVMVVEAWRDWSSDTHNSINTL